MPGFSSNQAIAIWAGVLLYFAAKELIFLAIFNPWDSLDFLKNGSICLISSLEKVVLLFILPVKKASGSQRKSNYVEAISLLKGY